MFTPYGSNDELHSGSTNAGELEEEGEEDEGIDGQNRHCMKLPPLPPWSRINWFRGEGKPSTSEPLSSAPAALAVEDDDLGDEGNGAPEFPPGLKLVAFVRL
jgi:hypothetical protein